MAKRSPQGRHCRASQRREVRGAPEPAREKRPSACSPCLAPWGLAARPPRGPSGCRAVLRHWSKGVAGPQAELCPAGPSGPEDKPHSTVGRRLATSFHPILSPKEPGPPGAAPCRRVGAPRSPAPEARVLRAPRILSRPGGRRGSALRAWTLTQSQNATACVHPEKREGTRSPGHCDAASSGHGLGAAHASKDGLADKGSATCTWTDSALTRTQSHHGATWMT